MKDSGIFRSQLRSCSIFAKATKDTSVTDLDLLPRNALLGPKSPRCNGYTLT